MANEEVESRSEYFGSAKVTNAELNRLVRMKQASGTWAGVRDSLISGDVPYFKPDQHDIDDVYDAGSADGCPVTKRLLEEEGVNPTELINLYIARHRANRMIARLLKQSGNNELLKQWQGDDDRLPSEQRVDFAIAGTPSALLERGNPHTGTAKYENFAICQFFRRLTDAEQGLEGPVEGLPKNKRLCPPSEVFLDDANEAKTLNDLNARFIARLVPILITEGVTHSQISSLLIDCFLAEPLLVEDNCWDRASNASKYLADYLTQSDDIDSQKVGTTFREKIASTINALKQ